jgi:hypothetical protein
MKTVKDLNELIPSLINLVLDNPEIGTRYFGNCEDDYEEEWAYNRAIYDENGWYIEIEYRCIADEDYDCHSSLTKAWGEIESIEASHDDENGGYIEFTDNDLNELKKEINKALERI